MMKRLFLTCQFQNNESRKWYPVGELNFDGETYRFFYIKGAETAQNEANFQPLVSFPDLREIYESTELFPMFANRVMPESRPEYRQTIEWLALAENQTDPLAFLARTGGAKVTDKFEIFCYPELDEKGDYNLHFFPHGLRYVRDDAIKRISSLERGDRLFLAKAFQNPYDKNALQLQTRDNSIVGYCPSYLLDDVNEIVEKNIDLEVCVERVNDELSVTFSDSGPGIKEEHQQIIFDPYFSTRPDGVGLGLTIVGELVTEYDGDFTLIDNGPLDGATFKITFRRRI